MNAPNPSNCIPIRQQVAQQQGIGQFLLCLNVRDRELGIMPMAGASPASEASETFALELSPSAEGSPDKVNVKTDTSDVPPIRLKVHARFIDRKGRASFNRTQSATQLVDTPAAQLAAELLSTEQVSVARESIVFCMVSMLCERIVSLLEYPKRASRLRFQDWQMAKLAKVFNEGKECAVPITAIASLCGLSTCHFSRLFRATYGASFRKYRTQQRIKRAQAQLSSSDDPISQIALGCGFADQSCFTRCFSAIAGMPPAVWRKHHRRSYPAAEFTPGPLRQVLCESGGAEI